MDFKIALLGLLIMECSYGYLIQGHPVCGEDEYWSKITGNCDPCSILCDPPTVYETACPRYCPEYKPIPPSTTSSPKSGDSSNVWLIVGLVTGAVVVILIILAACLVPKYWEHLRKSVPTCCLRDKERDDINFPVQEQSLMHHTEGPLGNTSRMDNTSTVDIPEEQT